MHLLPLGSGRYSPKCVSIRVPVSAAGIPTVSHPYVVYTMKTTSEFLSLFVKYIRVLASIPNESPDAHNLLLVRQRGQKCEAVSTR